MRGSINAEPDVRVRILERGDDYLVLATDGVWDVMSSQEACNIVCGFMPDLGPQARRSPRNFLFASLSTWRAIMARVLTLPLSNFIAEDKVFTKHGLV